jgi:hypothetical protein
MPRANTPVDEPRNGEATEPIDHHFTAHLVCPHCGHKHDDSWEMGNGEEGDWDDECHSCGKALRAQRHITVKYSTEKPK